MILLLGAALAAGLHAGIPVSLPGLGEPSFLTPESGWTTDVPTGFIRVFVGRDPAAAAAWVERERVALVLPAPPLSGVGDEAWGDGEHLVVLRDGNVGLTVRVASGARALALQLQGAIVDGVPWPAAPVVQPVGGEGGWQVVAPDAVLVQVEGANRVGASGDRLDRAPRRVVGWDAYGRPSIVELGPR